MRTVAHRKTIKGHRRKCAQQRALVAGNLGVCVFVCVSCASLLCAIVSIKCRSRVAHIAVTRKWPAAVQRGWCTQSCALLMVFRPVFKCCCAAEAVLIDNSTVHMSRTWSPVYILDFTVASWCGCRCCCLLLLRVVWTNIDIKMCVCVCCVLYAAASCPFVSASDFADSDRWMRKPICMCCAIARWSFLTRRRRRRRQQRRTVCALCVLSIHCMVLVLGRLEHVIHICSLLAHYRVSHCH